MTDHVEVTYYSNDATVSTTVFIGNLQSILSVERSKNVNTTWEDGFDHDTLVIYLNLSKPKEVYELSCIFTVYDNYDVEMDRSDNIFIKTTASNEAVSGKATIVYSALPDLAYFPEYVRVKCNITILDSVNNSGLNGINNTIFEKMKFADVNFIVQGKDFSAHKLFLTSRSKVFEAMFDHPMAESETNNIIVEDINPDVFHEMLRFIYTGEVKNLNEFAVELFCVCAADKYQLEELKKLCEGAVIKNMSVENACEILIIADRHSTATLKTSAVEFINTNVKNIKSTGNWKDFTVSHPELTLELFNALIDTL